MSAYTNVRLYKCPPHRVNTVVEHSAHHLKVECTSLAANTGTTNVRENYESHDTLDTKTVFYVKYV